MQAIDDSSGVEISLDHSMIRTKYSPEKWPMPTSLKVDAPEFVPRTQRAGNIVFFKYEFILQKCKSEKEQRNHCTAH